MLEGSWLGIMGMAPSRGGGRTVLETLFDSKENPVGMARVRSLAGAFFAGR